MSDDASPLLELDAVKTHYPIQEGWLRREVGRVRAVDGVDLSIEDGEAIGLVGESGSGKSTVARTIVGLETATDGVVRYRGTPVADLTAADRRAFQRSVQLIVQDPNEAFSPRMTIGEAVAEPLRLHGLDDRDRQRSIVTDLLERVGLSASDIDRYPHEFSGGEKQRIAIARALVVNPDLIVADEPTSALDSRVQADVLGLLDEIRREHDIAVLFISHDIDVVRLFCDRVAVMYLGTVVERGPIDRLLSEPAHPYTRLLLGSVPSLDPRDEISVEPLSDSIPDPADPPAGCRFHTRCPELIPGEETPLERSDWIAVAAFRYGLEAVEVPSEPNRIRDRFDIPAPLSDDDIEAQVQAAITALERDDVDTAIDHLRAVVSTPCEEADPPTVVADDQHVTCHRYSDQVDADPLTWEAESTAEASAQKAIQDD